MPNTLMTDVEYRDPTQIMLRVQVGMHSWGMIHAKHPNTACLQIIENFWAKHRWEGTSSLSTSHRVNKNGKLLRNKAASSGKVTSQQELPVLTLCRVHSFHGGFLLLCLTVYITFLNHNKSTNSRVSLCKSKHQSWLKDVKCQGGWSLAFYAFGTPSFTNMLQAILESHSSSKPSRNYASWLSALALTSVSYFLEWNSQVFIHLKKNQPPQFCFLC